MLCPPSEPINDAILPSDTDPANVGGGPGKLEPRVAGHHGLDEIDLVDGALKRIGDVGRDVHRPELGADAAREHAGDIGVVARQRGSRVGEVEVAVGCGPQLPGQVVVSVDHRQVGVDAKRSGREFVPSRQTTNRVSARRYVLFVRREDPVGELLVEGVVPDLRDLAVAEPETQHGPQFRHSVGGGRRRLVQAEATVAIDRDRLALDAVRALGEGHQVAKHGDDGAGPSMISAGDVRTGAMPHDVVGPQIRDGVSVVPFE